MSQCDFWNETTNLNLTASDTDSEGPFALCFKKYLFDDHYILNYEQNLII